MPSDPEENDETPVLRKEGEDLVLVRLNTNRAAIEAACKKLGMYQRKAQVEAEPPQGKRGPRGKRVVVERPTVPDRPTIPIREKVSKAKHKNPLFRPLFDEGDKEETDKDGPTNDDLKDEAELLLKPSLEAELGIPPEEEEDL